VIVTPDRGGKVDDKDGGCCCVGTDKDGDKDGGAVVTPYDGVKEDDKCCDRDGCCTFNKSERNPPDVSFVGIDEVLEFRPLTPNPKL